MIILSSDYDGTLKTRIIDLKANIEAIRRFRSLGNIFILNTGRHYSSIIEEIKRFNIPFDYLSCNDGGITFDSNFQVIKEHSLSNDQVRYIKELIPYFPGLRIVDYYDAYQICHNEIETPLEIGISKTHDSSFEEFSRVVVTSETDIEIMLLKNRLRVKAPTTKSTALFDIAKIIDVDPKTIYTIGDSPNDLEMIKNHHGFRMLESSPKVIFSTWRVVPEVRHLVNYLNWKSKRM